MNQDGTLRLPKLSSGRAGKGLIMLVLHFRNIFRLVCKRFLTPKRVRNLELQVQNIVSHQSCRVEELKSVKALSQWRNGEHLGPLQSQVLGPHVEFYKGSVRLWVP
ncbi:hypothetical protein TNCV_3055771 [Trichonephila clavipes]|nr:hypothetical protein TNCV_3055771 [Trichonephila clavipes]